MNTAPPCLNELAHEFLNSSRVMHLAVVREGVAWVAAVFYVHRRGDFYFFSSEKSAHIRDGVGAPCGVAAAVSQPSDDWRAIRGVQMRGEVVRVEGVSEKACAVGMYLAKFVFVRGFLATVARVGAISNPDPMSLSLYRLTSRETVYTDNSLGFGTRHAVDLFSPPSSPSLFTT